MSLNDLASIAIVVQGFLFIVSIGLVWYQLRENTRLTRTANTQKLVELFSPFNLQLAQDRGLTQLAFPSFCEQPYSFSVKYALPILATPHV